MTDPSILLILSIIIPLSGAIACYIFRNQGHLLAPLFLGIQVIVSASTMCICYSQGPFAISAGDWIGPFGIVLIADLLAALMLITSALVFLLSLTCNAQSSVREILPLIFMLQAGVNLSFISGDLFNLFVAFELILTSSYAILVLSTDSKMGGNTFSYLLMNLLASLLFLITIALFYATSGSLNLAALARAIEQLPTATSYTLISAITLVLMIKSGVFPLYFWLPDSYPRLPAPVAALFGGILSKVGLYALFRITFTVFGNADSTAKPILIALGCITMLLGVCGAVSRSSFKGILSYHIVSQVGYMVVAVGISTPLALAAGIFFLLHNMIVKSSLFLAAGLAQEIFRTDKLSAMGGLWKTSPLLGSLFLIQALSLAGIPPLSGFWSKYLLFYEEVRTEYYLVVAISVLTSFFTLFSMIKIWNSGFLGESKGSFTAPPYSKYIGLIGLTLAGLILGLATPITVKICQKAADELIDSRSYIGTSNFSGQKGR